MCVKCALECIQMRHICISGSVIRRPGRKRQRDGRVLGERVVCRTNVPYVEKQMMHGGGDDGGWAANKILIYELCINA